MSYEQWRAVVGYEGYYEVSDQGRVRSLPRKDRLGRDRPGIVLKLQADRDGYPYFLASRGTQKMIRVHRAVLNAFVGPAPAGAAMGLHADGNPANNVLSNLRWGTDSDNQRDAVKHGTHSRTARTHCKAGHAFDEQNTYRYPGTGWRACRACFRNRARARYAEAVR